jgi:hypothetical protein
MLDRLEQAHGARVRYQRGIAIAFASIPKARQSSSRLERLKL